MWHAYDPIVVTLAGSSRCTREQPRKAHLGTLKTPVGTVKLKVPFIEHEHCPMPPDCQKDAERTFIPAQLDGHWIPSIVDDGGGSDGGEGDGGGGDGNGGGGKGEGGGGEGEGGGGEGDGDAT